MATISLIITSITTMVLQDGLFNFVTKKRIRGSSAILSFNFFIYIVCVIICGALMFTQKISLYTIVLGLLFGLITLLYSIYKLLALTEGPMHITLLFTTSSMVIPTLSGIFFGEKFSPVKLMMVFVLLFFLYLSFEKSNETKMGGKWFFFSLLAFLFQGTLGVLQKIHQTSAHKEESVGLLFVAFICALLSCLVRSKGRFEFCVLNKKVLFIASVCGACTFAVNFINLKLAGLLPSQLFFPLINGSAIVLSSILSIVLFKEHLSKRQAVGLAGGIVCLIAICLVG